MLHENWRNMIKLVKFLYVMIIFLSIIFIAMNDNRKSTCYPFQISFFTSYSIVYLILITIFILFLISAVIRCVTDLNCPQDMCPSNKIAKCRDTRCECMPLQSHGRGIFFPT